MILIYIIINIPDKATKKIFDLDKSIRFVGLMDKYGKKGSVNLT
jgi:hypothetical protein